MARFKITLEYDGTKFYGWQYQRNHPTIMGKIMEACEHVFGTNDFELYGSGRTDSGVHALAQVAHLDVRTTLQPHIIRMKLNDELPAAINILNVETAPNRFHARYDAVARSYVYHISTRRTAFGKNNCWWIKDKLNVVAMADAAMAMEGFKDFQSFGSAEDEESSTKVEIEWVRVYEMDHSIIVHIVGSHFLWKMVRRMIGVLVEVGRGNISPKEVESLFIKKSDLPAKLTAPPAGLYLDRVYYQGEELSPDPKWIINIFRHL